MARARVSPVPLTYLNINIFWFYRQPEAVNYRLYKIFRLQPLQSVHKLYTQLRPWKRFHIFLLMAFCFLYERALQSKTTFLWISVAQGTLPLPHNKRRMTLESNQNWGKHVKAPSIKNSVLGDGKIDALLECLHSLVPRLVHENFPTSFDHFSASLGNQLKHEMSWFQIQCVHFSAVCRRDIERVIYFDGQGCRQLCIQVDELSDSGAKC